MYYISYLFITFISFLFTCGVNWITAKFICHQSFRIEIAFIGWVMCLFFKNVMFKEVDSHIWDLILMIIINIISIVLIGNII